MAGFLDGLLGGGAGDEYGDLLTPAQRNAVQARGLLAMAGAFGEAAMPSRTPIPIGAVLGKAAGALGAGQDAAVEAQIQNALRAQQVTELKNKMAMRALLAPFYQQLMGGGGTATPGPGSPAAPGPGGGGLGGPAALPIPRLGSDYAKGLTPTREGIQGQLNPDVPSGFGAGSDFLSNPLGSPTLGLPAGVGGALRGRDLGAEGDYAQSPLGRASPSALPPAPYDPAALPDLRRPGGLLDPFASGAPAIDAGGAPKAQATGAESSWDQQRAAGQLQGPLAGGGSGGGAPPVAPPEAGGDTDVAAAPDTVVPPGGGGLLGVSPDLYRPIEATPAAAQTRRVLDLIQRYESGGRNINQQVIPAGGGYNPSVGRVTGPSSASGYFQMIDPTWRHAAQLSGIDTSQYPRAIDAPYDLQRQAAAKLLQTEGLAPWAPYNANLRAALQNGGGAPDQVIPPAGGSNLPVMQAQYAPRVPGMPELAPTPPLQAPGGLAATGGKVPGTNLTPQQLMAADALAEMSGLGNPFKGFLESYYKSPGYLEEAAGATSRGKVAVEEPSQMRIQQQKAQLDAVNKMREQGMTLDANGNVIPIPGHAAIQGMNAGEIQQAQEKAKAQFDLVDAQVKMPDGQTMTVKMPRYEYIYRQQHPAGGAGDIVGTPYFTPEQTTSQQKGAEAGWKALEDTHTVEVAANRSDQLLGQMAEAMRGFQPGATAEARIKGASILKDLGIIKGEEVPNAETFQRAARRLQIAASAVHQGQVSNYERELFASTVQQMTDSPEGLAKAIDIARRLNDYDRQISAIHRSTVVNGVPNLVEAQRRIAALGPPMSPGEMAALEDIRAGKVPSPATTIAPAGVIKTPYGTIRPVQ